MGVHLQIPHHHIWKEEKRGNSRISGNCLNYFWWIRFNAVMWRYPSSRLAIATWVRSLMDLPAFSSNNWMKSCSERACYMLLQLVNALKVFMCDITLIKWLPPWRTVGWRLWYFIGLSHCSLNMDMWCHAKGNIQPDTLSDFGVFQFGKAITTQLKIVVLLA